MPDPTTPTIDSQLFRDVTGHYPTGVVVVTGRDAEGELLAMVVGSFNSVSLEPPLVSFMPMKTSRTFAKMRECPSVCINILAGEQEDVVFAIAQRWENKFDGIAWHPSPSGDPVLADAVAWIDTRIDDVIEAGDHWIVLCAVHDMAVENPVSPLIYFQSGYGSFVCTSLMARMDHEILPAIHAAHAARPIVEHLAKQIGCEVTIFTSVSEDEVATVLSVTGPGMGHEGDFARRVPMIPPIGDTYFFDQPTESQERWIERLRGADPEVKETFRQRLSYLRENGYLYSRLPEDQGRAAYEIIRDATELYSSGRLTPAQQRIIRSAMINSSVDYRVEELDEDQRYQLGSIVVPVRDRRGVYSLTLRLAQLPAHATRRQIENWLGEARRVVDILEG
ncbi:flavin reductase family protein [Gordonia aichiensis]|uniref:Putative oxidoreductase n=1 Tax=Gordonia aichiensis NBRC 108223 TaxID=1220583 RepID=L7KPE1_9ACTN|nr:flavin reductase family protein [Gordonia aichiensis]GAC50735.1 putative oxidoreductase [Gordonia aichiensis NBRC 108223]